MTIKIRIERLEIDIEELPKTETRKEDEDIEKEPKPFPKFDRFMDLFSQIQTGGDIGVTWGDLRLQLDFCHFSPEEVDEYLKEALKRGKIYERQHGIYMLTDRSKHVYNDVNLTDKFCGRYYDKSKLTD
jgi:hypothetical protein